MATSFEDLGESTSMAALKSRFAECPWWDNFREAESLNDEAPRVRLIEGPLELDGDLHTGSDPWAVIVDGSLTLSGTLECYTEDARTSTLIVTGPVRAANLFFASAAQVWVGSLELSGFVIGTWGDSGAWLSSAGPLIARGVLLDSHTAAYGHPTQAIVLAGRGWQNLVPDIADGENALFVPEVRDRGGPFLNFHAARDAAKSGRPVFDVAQEASLRGRKGL
ncbi:MAG: hypothetical protein QM778_22760 [Myxococcales bacterium]